MITALGRSSGNSRLNITYFKYGNSSCHGTSQSFPYQATFLTASITSISLPSLLSAIAPLPASHVNRINTVINAIGLPTVRRPRTHMHALR